MNSLPEDEHQPLAAQATLAHWRLQGDHARDPVRFCFMEALARRAARHGGEVRRLLERRLAQEVHAFEAALAGGSAQETQPPAKPARGPLGALVDLLAQETAPSDPDVPAQPAAARTLSSLTSPAELKTLSHFRSTWSRLSADQRLRQALAGVPENAGPLNSNRLVHRALALMQALSPDYLAHFMAYVDALAWMDPVGNPVETTPRTDSRAKTGRGRTA